VAHIYNPSYLQSGDGRIVVQSQPQPKKKKKDKNENKTVS
jgi:hypothetical protein